MQVVSQQYLRKVNFDLLKNLKNVEIDFSGSKLTAIVGVNGSGKSTVLHALACCFKPLNEELTKNYKFSQFFTPTSDSVWQGSRLTISYDYRVGRDTFENESTVYSKNTDRWSPKYDRRPKRHIFYLGINSCVPTIEEEKQISYIRYNTTNLNDEMSRKIKEKAGFVMNRDYNTYNLHTSSKRKYIGVEHQNTSYSSLSMSAGEQRVFKILTEVLNAPKNSLILIDEIDLLLHVFALKRLISVLYSRAEEMNLQIVFTTHSTHILDENEHVNIRHLYNTASKTLCFADTKPDTIYRLTGENSRPIELFVEDDLAVTIVNHIIESLNMLKYTRITRYGAAINCFTVASGMLLSEKLHSDCFFVLDGDEYKEQEQKQGKINAVLTGTAEYHYEWRQRVLLQISQFNLPEGFSPERYIHSLLKDLSVTMTNQITETANEISKVDNDHRYVDDILQRINYQNKMVGLSKIIELVSNHPDWPHYTSSIREWLISRKQSVIEVEAVVEIPVVLPVSTI